MDFGVLIVACCVADDVSCDRAELYEREREELPSGTVFNCSECVLCQGLCSDAAL